MRPFAILAAMLLFLPVTGAALEPLVQNAHARDGISLDGEWARIVDPYENGYYNHRMQPHDQGYFANRAQGDPSELIEYSFAQSPHLAVPGDWNSQEPELFLYEGTVWYQRDFDLGRKPGRRYVVHFGAVNYTAIVYVNGAEVGRHEGGFTPFQFDITDQVRDGSNFVVVKADNRREKDQVPTVNTDWWNYGGITRRVRILDLPSDHLADYFLSYSDGAISGWVQTSGRPGSVRVDIPGLQLSHAVQTGDDGFGRFVIEASPRLWSPDSPDLYDVRLSFGDDRIHDRIGFRHVAVDGVDIKLNGRPVFLRGICLHEEAPGGGRAWSEAHARQLLGWAKELGANFVRLAHYPHNENMTRIADELGLMVWSEIPVYWTIDFTSEAVFTRARQQLREMIARDRNRASVVLWSIANETPGTPARTEFLTRLADHARELDGSRLLTAALDTQRRGDGENVIDDPLAAAIDVIGINNYCGWYGPLEPGACAAIRWRSDYGKPVIMSEFGGGALQGHHGPADQRWTEEYQADVYRYNLQMIDGIEFLRGMTPWILMDFRSPRRPLPGIQDYWNRKGLLSENGEKKAAWQLIRDYYAAKEEAAR
jgi:beta-glucuronidase